MVQAIHTAVAGRARFKVEGLYRSKSLEKLLEYRLVRLTDISHASANALTGNVLVCFNSGNTPQTIASLIEEIVSQYQSQPQISARPEPAAKIPMDVSGQKGPATVLDRFKDLFSLTEPQEAEPWHQSGSRGGAGEMADFPGNGALLTSSPKTPPEIRG